MYLNTEFGLMSAYFRDELQVAGVVDVVLSVKNEVAH